MVPQIGPLLPRTFNSVELLLLLLFIAQGPFTYWVVYSLARLLLWRHQREPYCVSPHRVYGWTEEEIAEVEPSGGSNDD